VRGLSMAIISLAARSGRVIGGLDIGILLL
jgi:hypothetical protein